KCRNSTSEAVMPERNGAERKRIGAAALEIRGLNVYYGASHALQGVDLTLDSGIVSVVGRNGMGKTTLCKAIMGLVPVSGGSLTVEGAQRVGGWSSDIAQMGSGYAPQGGGVWRSLTVDEHLGMVAAGKSGGWTIDRIY